jgi:hypothetical protein
VGLAPWLLLLTLEGPAAAAPAAQPTAEIALDVPYLPQTEALCGGAAAAMIFRYWGDRHADVQQFAPLVDRRTRGIGEDVLMRAITDRGWVVTRVAGSPERIRGALADRLPLMLLIEDRPGRYHYVVAVGAGADRVSLHDPTWGPSRPMPIAELVDRWRPTGFWALLVTPDPDRPPRGSARMRGAGGFAAPRQGDGGPEDSRCTRLLDKAVADIAVRGLGAANEILDEVNRECPHDGRPLAELAGVRFAERRWRDASALAEQSVRRHPEPPYAWDVLGSSRFMQNDPVGALGAWNRLDKPRVDLVNIEGLKRTRYALVAEALDLQPGSLLTPGRFRLAERRLGQFPDRSGTRIGFRPDPEGFAIVDVALVERSRRPRGWMEWTAAGVQAVLDQEVAADIPGGTGQGELWTGSWRWWRDRPRLAASFSAPLVRLRGLLRVEGARDAQSYEAGGSLVREERTTGALTFGQWATADLHYLLSAGLSSWSGGNRTVSVGGMVEPRFLGDRLSLAAAIAHSTPLGTIGPSFRSGSLGVSFISSAEPTGLVGRATASLDIASAGAPLAFWGGAGEGRARPGLLRAHPLLERGTIAGPVFGRRVSTASAELTRWFAPPSLPRVGVAGFVDAAGAWRRLPGASGQSVQIDAGAGLRLRLPGRDATLRVDYGRGLRDGAHAVTVGWQKITGATDLVRTSAVR